MPDAHIEPSQPLPDTRWGRIVNPAGFTVRWHHNAGLLRKAVFEFALDEAAPITFRVRSG